MGNNFQETLKKHEKIIGIIASGLAIVMFVSILEVLMSNLRGESNIFLQPMATALSGFFWSLYGYSRKDLVILVPNLVALLLGLLTALSVLM